MMLAEMRIKVFIQKAVSGENNVLENTRSPIGVNMTRAYNAHRVRNTPNVDFNMSTGFPHVISSMFMFPPFEANIGLPSDQWGHERDDERHHSCDPEEC